MVEGDLEIKDCEVDVREVQALLSDIRHPKFSNKLLHEIRPICDIVLQDSIADFDIL